jgi:hypothetical protein
MIDGIRVDSRDQIEPIFRIPAVRIHSGDMEPTEVNANRFARLSADRISLGTESARRVADNDTPSE